MANQKQNQRTRFLHIWVSWYWKEPLIKFSKLAGLEIQGSVLSEYDGGGEDGVITINDEGGVAVRGGGRRISALHGEIEESKHESNGGFLGERRERGDHAGNNEEDAFSDENLVAV